MYIIDSVMGCTRLSCPANARTKACGGHWLGHVYTNTRNQLSKGMKFQTSFLWEQSRDFRDLSINEI